MEKAWPGAGNVSTNDRLHQKSMKNVGLQYVVNIFVLTVQKMLSIHEKGGPWTPNAYTNDGVRYILLR